MARSLTEFAHADLQFISKTELHALADGLIMLDQGSLDRCVEFVISETRGLWHGRARAIMCRRLKHCQLGRTHHTQLVNCITDRLISGEFSEQFKDQLRLLMRLDLNKAFEAARKSAANAKPHVARYAQWVLSHDDSI
jgi:hypothetical protein